MNEQIKARLKRLPTEPGVYLYYNAANEVIYVGKAKNLKKRVSSYFQKTNHPIKVRRLVAQIETIDFIVLNSESEALLLECDLIKQYRPRYNVLLRDDKSYPYIIVDPRHDFPRLQSYRGEVQENGIEFYGPYASPSTVRKTLEVLHQLFMLRQCGDHDFKTRKRPCLQYQIKRCSAPCVGYIDKAAYGEQVNLVREYLQGKQQHIIELFSEKMNEASQRMDYEEAAHYRDKVRLLQKLHYSSYTIHFQDPVDIICVAKIADRYGAYCFSFRKGHCLGGYFFELQNEQDDETSALLTAFVLQYYQSHQDLPKTIVIGQSLKDKSLLADSLSKRHKQKIAIKTQLNEELQTWYALAQENLKQSIHQHYKHLHDYAEKFTALQLALQMDSPLERIECFDISHTQGQDTVASCVVFNEQGPDKKRYRIYRIEGITPGDDYAAMRQVVMKRYKKLIAQGASLPSVILIDGGKGQLRQAVKVLTELGVDFEQTGDACPR